ncbi:MAG: fibronectin type III domain-containing protein, partial [Acidobacteriia bacterium]|nr:fibronectin type III domain-containing protein [Terriglobia bacterium]
PGPPVITGVAVSGITASSATISWSTDQASSSQVEYGATASYGSTSTFNATLSTTHSVTLAGLSAGSAYDFAVLSQNSSGTLATSANFTFQTLPGPPVISGVAVSGITASSATISWSTDQASSSQVEYGATASYGSTSTFNSTLSTTHSVTLTGLSAGSAYDFAVLSQNSSGALATSANFTFQTLPGSLVISNVAATNITNSSATITWTTSQPASSEVEYGPSDWYSAVSTFNANRVTSHSVSLTGLTPNTVYNYAALSQNKSGAVLSENFNFQTLASAP